MVKIKLTELELNQIHEIQNSELVTILNNSLNGLELNLSEIDYGNMYDILLNYSDTNLFALEFLDTYLKYDNNNIIKPFNINAI